MINQFLDQEYFDIIEDVKAELSQYGQVSKVVVPRKKDNFPCEGNIFVEFYNPMHAKNAAASLIGRRFAERTVAVSYYDEMLFSNNQLI